MDLLIADDTVAAILKTMNPTRWDQTFVPLTVVKRRRKLTIIPDNWSSLHNAERERMFSFLQVHFFPQPRVRAKILLWAFLSKLAVCYVLVGVVINFRSAEECVGIFRRLSRVLSSHICTYSTMHYNSAV